jgi:hypothetical protein
MAIIKEKSTRTAVIFEALKGDTVGYRQYEFKDQPAMLRDM